MLTRDKEIKELRALAARLADMGFTIDRIDWMQGFIDATCKHTGKGYEFRPDADCTE